MGTGGHLRFQCGSRQGLGCPTVHGAPLSLAPAQAASSSSWSKDEIQGLPFGSCHVGVPEIHHEDCSWAILSRTWGGGA